MVQLLTRTCQRDLAQAVDIGGWSTKLKLSSDAVSSLETLLHAMDDFNGQGIKSIETAIPLQSFVEAPKTRTGKETIAYRGKFDSIVAGDASDRAVCAYAVSGPDFYLREKLKDEQKKWSSGHRELHTVLSTLQEHGQELRRRRGGAATIMWLTDSTNLTCFLEKGSTKPKIQEDILRVFWLARSLQLVLVPIHLLRSDPRLELADAGSKCVEDTDDWSIDHRAFTEINEEYRGKLDVDLFADPENRSMEKYYAKFHCPGSEGTDAFGYSWEGLRAWICPPTGRAVQTIKKIANSRMRGVLVLPAWRSSIFWPLISPDGTHLSHFFDGARIFRPYVVPGKTNDNAKFTLMRGHTPFPFVALFIKSNGNGKPRVGAAEMPKELGL